MKPIHACSMIPALWVFLIPTALDRAAAEPLSDSQRTPNLIVIQTDEHNFRTLGCYRETLPDDQAMIWGKDGNVETPAIDSLAHRGAICTSFYATSPVCTPSRASFFTGHYPHRTGSPQNDLPMRSDMVTFAQVLQDHGYATGYAGKWHLDGTGKPQWAPQRQFGFADNRFMFNRGHWKKLALTAEGPRVASRNASDQPTYGLGGADKESFSTDWLTDRALDFIREHAEQPFCYHLSLPDPHGPNSVRPPYDEMYSDRVVRPPMTFGETQNNPGWVAGKSKNAKVRFNPQLMTLYFGMVRCIDDNVARILHELNRLGLTDNTIIVFTSDHGDLCFEHGRLNKGNPYEGSAKIPMIIAAPRRVPAKTRIDVALGTVDFTPTILSLMNVSCKQTFDGRDAADWFRGTTPDRWDDISILRAASSKPSWVAAVSDRYKLVVSVSDQPWLFDLENDPDELVNQYGSTESETVTQRMAEKLIAYAKRTEDPQLEIGGPIRKQLRAIVTKKPVKR